MHGLILAGGEGSRLAADGVAGPKAAVRVGGRAQILRLIDTFAALGCETITCMVRDVFPDVLLAIESARALLGGRVRAVACHTPSSLHTLADGLRVVPPGPVFCSMVDTVMTDRDWQLVYDDAMRQLMRDCDAVLAVTPFVDDENPLWVDRGAGGVARRVGGPPVAPPCVTGGVYAFSSRARDAAEDARCHGSTRMRYFLGDLVREGARVGTVEVARIVDLDHKRDIDTADALLAANLATNRATEAKY
ncbi:MAG TPA: NTP transferase domain-containing protein [Gemmatimonadaceae bacterium]|jgi:GTP:adenosylcobinamide-phosphate guanylyltransferase|nr:NTP transferase domain-containing protein [Gemmatimonadaceae bacterium]